MIVNVMSEGGDDGPLVPFHFPVGFQVVCGGQDFRDVEDDTNVLKELGDELDAIIG